ncbi:MAG: hypothetical protein ACPLSP_00200, partial [Fervidicoccus fontis]
ELYRLIRKKLEGSPWLDDLLAQLTDCEGSAFDSIIIYDSSGKLHKGVKMRVKPVLESDGYSVDYAENITLLESESDWEELPKSTENCIDTRILKQGELVVIECIEPKLSLEEVFRIIKEMESPSVLCYYEWE